MAQSYFGQNQVQYDRFDWRVKETEHFLVYYYPEEQELVQDAARMAERAYVRLSRILDHQFREKKPIVLFASRNDFGQNNVTGDLGEGTGGVTEALRHRMLLNFTGDYRSFEHVLTHELVHAFQYDVFARGKAGHGLQTLAQFMPPLWFMEGMAEYLSLGPNTSHTNTWMRDAALNGRLPTLEQLTRHPRQFFPYRYGHAFWSYVGHRWGDESIGQIMQAVPGVGFERAIKRELGITLEDLGDEWKETLQQQLLPQTGGLDRARRFAQPLLTKRRSGGEVFLAPALSSDGRTIAFLSNGSLTRGEVFIDLWLADAKTGKRQQRLVKSTTNPDYEELRLLYSQSAFSPDGRSLAFTAQRSGRDVLYLADVRTGKTLRRYDLPLEGVTGPSFSPDGRRLAFSGSRGGVTDIYVMDVDGRNFQRLTQDRFGDLQPNWSPDGTRIAFATDRDGPESLRLLDFPPLRIAVLDLARGSLELLPDQKGLNFNPQWAPDSRSLAYVSDRTGIPNVFLFDLGDRQHYQLTNVVGGISGITEYSPAITWARQADRLAFTYFEDGVYTIWSVANPRALRKGPVREAPALVAAADPTLTAPPNGHAADSARARDSVPAATSLYRSAGGFREAAELPRATGGAHTAPVTIAALLDSATIGLPDTTKFRDQAYRVRLMPDYVARPTIGYAPDNFGRNVFGGTTLIMSDMLGNHRMAVSGEVNGRMAEARAFLGYTNVGGRWQWSTGFSQAPYYFLSGDSLTPLGGTKYRENQEITVFIARQIFGVASYPFNRFSRVEAGLGLNNIGRRRWFISRDILDETRATIFDRDSIKSDAMLNYVDAQLAYVSDNTLFGYTGALAGRRYRLQVSPVAGSYRWIEYLADYRRYDPIIFNYLTLATRVYANMSVGRDELQFPKYIARPDYIRGYDRNNSFYLHCPMFGANTSNCSTIQLLGSRVAVANVELRFPLVRRIELGFLPISLPPIEGVLFHDMGVAWSKDQTLYGTRPSGFDARTQRFPVRSWGTGLRINLFNYAMLRWDYAIPLDAREKKGFWTWSLWPGF
ncbi:MAG TPA: hypothetical protein VEA99_06310 [Gemmatimonadaceae bacterium]|nr:hypothetical protein [Gemmatimonadaceae bacterium]